MDASDAGSSLCLEPIGVVRNGRLDASDTGWGELVSVIELDVARFGPESLRGLEAFSHVEVIFHFDRIAESSVVYGSRHPRNDPQWPESGIFAQRAAVRPNRLGITRAAIVAVQGSTLSVKGLDALDGTPVLDIKPYLREFAPAEPVRQPAWCAEVMQGYF